MAGLEEVEAVSAVVDLAEEEEDLAVDIEVAVHAEELHLVELAPGEL